MATILLLEPDTHLGKIYSNFLEDSGHVVKHCKEAGLAISMLDSHKIDIVILEVQVALHNGIEFLYEMRSYSEWQDILVIINSIVPKQVLEQNKLFRKQLRIAEILYKPTTKLNMLASCIKSNLPVNSAVYHKSSV